VDNSIGNFQTAYRCFERTRPYVSWHLKRFEGLGVVAAASFTPRTLLSFYLCGTLKTVSPFVHTVHLRPPAAVTVIGVIIIARGRRNPRERNRYHNRTEGLSRAHYSSVWFSSVFRGRVFYQFRRTLFSSPTREVGCLVVTSNVSPVPRPVCVLRCGGNVVIVAFPVDECLEHPVLLVA